MQHVELRQSFRRLHGRARSARLLRLLLLTSQHPYSSPSCSCTDPISKSRCGNWGHGRSGVLFGSQRRHNHRNDNNEDEERNCDDREHCQPDSLEVALSLSETLCELPVVACTSALLAGNSTVHFPRRDVAIATLTVRFHKFPFQTCQKIFREMP